MMTLRRHSALISVAAACTLSSCALTSRSEPLRVRYFTLEDAAHGLPPNGAQSNLELRLGRVDASGDLSEELAVRTGQNELTYREDQRWTEKPEQFLRRGLERALFQQRGVTRVYSGLVPTLDVELIELAEVQGERPLARVRALAHLHDERRGLCDEAFSVEQPIATSGAEQPEQTVAALSTALHTAIGKLADRVVQCLSRVASATVEPDTGTTPADAQQVARP